MSVPRKIMTIFGTRPGAIKMAPIITAMRSMPDQFEPVVVVTAQHRQLLDQVLNFFAIEPDFDLNTMQPRDSLSERTSKMLHHLDNVINAAQPDMILVVGDASTTLAAGLAAFYHKIPVGHVEAGLRTYDKYAPFPEEMNRHLTDVLSDLYFAPTTLSRDNLIAENHSVDNVFITGNTSIDALKYTVRADYHHPTLDAIPANHRILLMTMQRRENLGTPMKRVFHAIRDVVETNPDVELIYPVHPNPDVMAIADDLLGGRERIHLVEPLDLLDFHNFAARSYLILTDSGGIQEEAPALDKPVLVLRTKTERPEGVTAGTVRLVGTFPEEIQRAAFELLHDSKEYKKMAHAPNPFGDGNAATRILKVIKDYFDNEQ